MICSPFSSSCLWPSSGYFSNSNSVRSLSAQRLIERICRNTPSATKAIVPNER